MGILRSIPTSSDSTGLVVKILHTLGSACEYVCGRACENASANNNGLGTHLPLEYTRRAGLSDILDVSLDFDQALIPCQVFICSLSYLSIVWLPIFFGGSVLQPAYSVIFPDQASLPSRFPHHDAMRFEATAIIYTFPSCNALSKSTMHISIAILTALWLQSPKTGSAAPVPANTTTKSDGLQAHRLPQLSSDLRLDAAEMVDYPVPGMT